MNVHRIRENVVREEIAIERRKRRIIISLDLCSNGFVNIANF